MEKTVGYCGEALTLAQVQKRLEEAKKEYNGITQSIGEHTLIIERLKKEGERAMNAFERLSDCKEVLEYELGREENEREDSCK